MNPKSPDYTKSNQLKSSLMDKSITTDMLIDLKSFIEKELKIREKKKEVN